MLWTGEGEGNSGYILNRRPGRGFGKVAAPAQAILLVQTHRRERALTPNRRSRPKPEVESEAGVEVKVESGR